MKTITDNLLDLMLKDIHALDGVESVCIVSNFKTSFDPIYQLPPKSIRVVVKGGKKKKIAKVIWNLRPIGMRSVGNTSVTVKDLIGYEHTENFERVV